MSSPICSKLVASGRAPSAIRDDAFALEDGPRLGRADQHRAR